MGVRIKMCGFTRTQDLEAAVALGVDAVGLVLDPCPQQVDRSRIPDLLSASEGALSVAVTGPTDVDGIARTLELGFDVIQAVLSVEAWARLDPALPVLPVLFDGPELVQKADSLMEIARPPTPLGRLNVDGAGGGGRGVEADWSRAAACVELGPIMLSGGLRADNVAAALEAVRPTAIDVSSFIEETPGVKTPSRMRAFLRAAREAERERPHTAFSH
ncbi:MAG: hypothetical protein AAGD10_18785 [Myxococcota bacterium]